MSLRGPKPPPKKQDVRTKTFRLPPELDDYLGAASAQLRRSENDIVIGAIELDRDLPLELGEEHRQALADFATVRGLSLDEHLAKVIAIAIRRAIECEGVDCAGAKKKK